MAEAQYQIEPIVSEPFAENSYVAWRQGSAEALVVDPGFDPESILDVIRLRNLRPVAILNTHGHSDHIAGNAALKAAFPDVPLIIGCNDVHLLTDPEANLSAPFGLPLTSPPADRTVADGERLDVGGFSFEVREVPGHSPGSVVFLCDQDSPPWAFVGDVLFSGSVGRADFPGGSARQLLSGIRSKLFNLPDGTLILPGHGPATTIGAERRSNPFVGENAKLYDLG